MSQAGSERIDHPQFRIGLDPVNGIVRSEALTVLTAADVDRYVLALGGMLTVARRRFGRALVLADLRAAPIRPQVAADRLREHNEKLYRPGERVALLVESSLMTLQLRRNLVPEYQDIFVSEPAAIAWLLSGDQAEATAD